MYEASGTVQVLECKLFLSTQCLIYANSPPTYSALIAVASRYSLLLFKYSLYVSEANDEICVVVYNMLDLFTIFSKSGLVLWCFQGTSQSFTSSVNALIKSVILQERGGLESFTHEALTLKYKLDNEFELVFVVAYQKFLKLSYVDKFLSDIQIEFRNKYKVRG